MELKVDVQTSQDIIAVAVEELNQFGCPYCGYRSGYTPISQGGSASWMCGECGKGCCILAAGMEEASFTFGGIRPKLQPHPRRGIPSHGRPDIKPETGGEFFRPRGLGTDVSPGCFACEPVVPAPEMDYHRNVAAFVQCKDAGERVVQMFKAGAWLDYREHYPDRVQVKIGACVKHVANLQRLYELTAADGTITEEKVSEALKS